MKKRIFYKINLQNFCKTGEDISYEAQRKKICFIRLIHIVTAMVIPRAPFLQNFISKLNESRIRFKLRND